MADDDIACPVGPTDRDPDLAARPLVFAPKGLLIAVLPGPGGAQRAAEAPRTTGSADRELRISTSEQILQDHARHIAQMSLPTASPRRSPTTGRPSTSTTGMPVTAGQRCGSTSPTTTRPTAPSAASPTAGRCTSGTTATATGATPTSSGPRSDHRDENRRAR